VPSQGHPPFRCSILTQKVKCLISSRLTNSPPLVLDWLQVLSVLKGTEILTPTITKSMYIFLTHTIVEISINLPTKW
jgi:hypothetical protein